MTETFIGPAEDVPPEDMANNRPPIDTGILEGPPRSRIAIQYEKKIKRFLHGIMRETAASPKLAPDAAALIVYSGGIASSGGNLAEFDPRFRHAVDFITDGSQNPHLAFMFACAPLILQVWRNHESVADVQPVREVRIPFLKRTVKLRFRLRLRNPYLRNMTSEPGFLYKQVFGNPHIKEALQKEGISVASYPF